MALIHGGDAAGYRLDYGGEPLDFSANCSPLGIPDDVSNAIALAAKKAYEYPDPLCRELCAAICAHEGVDNGQVFCANGAADIIFRLPLAERPKRALILAPTFAEYRIALELAGCEVETYCLKEENGFALDAGLLDRLRGGYDMLIICAPNNPTGLCADYALMTDIMELCARIGTLLVVDECFNGFLNEPEKHSMRRYVGVNKKLLILNAFTKLYGMAGVRLGYCLCSDMELLERLRLAGQPWAVSSLAQSAGLAALKQTEYVKAVRKLVAVEREHMKIELVRLGFTVFDGQANYLLFRTNDAKLCEKLRKEGILLRNCSNYDGLSAGYYRTAIKKHDENIVLISALERLG